MKYIILLLIGLVTIQEFQAQEYKSFSWTEDPSEFMEDSFDEQSSVFVLRKEHVELVEGENSGIEQFNLTHRIYFLNSDESIERYNRVYIPIAPQRELIANKARVISPTGKIMELDESKIIEAVDEETKRKLKYFAFEGIEKGSYIEYYHIMRMSPQAFGRRIDFQHSMPVRKAIFQLKTPSPLEFKFKSYNGLNEVNVEDVDNHTIYSVKSEDIPQMPDEELSTPRTHLQFLIYAIDNNNYNNSKDLSSYSSVAKNIHNYLNQELSKKQQKKLDKIFKSLKLDQFDELGDQVMAIENYIKRNYYMAESGNPDLTDFDFILENQVANDRGVMLLYMKLLELSDIDATPVITSNREEFVFDPEFEAHNYLQKFLILIDDANAYVAPENANARYPFIPSEFADNYGLFLRKLKVGDFVSASSEVDFIAALEAEKNIDKIRANVSFDDENPTLLHIDYLKSWTGYGAVIFHPFIDLIDTENRKDITRSYAETIVENLTIVNWDIKNDQPELFAKEPLVFDYQLLTDELVTQAGPNLVFNVGLLIGRQVEMYQEKKRSLPVEGQNNRIYDRVVKVNLPDGYEVQNLDDLNIKETAAINGNEVMLFHSYYTLEDNVLTVHADEFYKETVIPVEHFEDYRRVINSAADFNSVNLVLKPM